MSAMGLPQVTVVHGNATAGGAYQPGLSDYMIVVRGKTEMFLAGPPLLKAATGEVAEEEPGRRSHARAGGGHGGIPCRERCRRHSSGARHCRHAGLGQGLCHQDFGEPLYPADDILGLIPCDLRKPYDVQRNHRLPDR
jgi:geranyl-CoA carboxylase beta subunit